MYKKVMSLFLAVLIILGSFTSFAEIAVRNLNYVSNKDFIESFSPGNASSDISLRPIIKISLKEPYLLSDTLSGKTPNVDNAFDEFTGKTTIGGQSLKSLFLNHIDKGIRIDDGSSQIIIDMRYADASLSQNTSYELLIPARTLNLRNTKTDKNLVNYILASTFTNREKISLKFRTGTRNAVSPMLKVWIDGKEIYAGDKGINPRVKDIIAGIDDANFHINPDYIEGNSIKGVKIKYFSGGTEGELTKADFKTIGSKSIPKRFAISIDGTASGEYTNPQSLKEFTHYYIEVPRGFFVDEDGNLSDLTKFNFATASYEGDSDILIPQVRLKEKLIDFKNNTITMVFLDDIQLNPLAVIYPENYFKVQIKSVDGTAFVDEDLNNYSFSFSGNKLIIKKKSNVPGSTSPNYNLIDTKSYRIKINPYAIYLTNSKEFEELYYGRKIYNGAIDEVFQDKNYIIEVLADWTKNADGDFSDIPQDNEPVNPLEWPKITYDEKGKVKVEFGERRLSRNPVIKIRFSKPVNVKDLSKILFTSDAETFALEKNESVWAEGDSLYFDLGNVKKGMNLLRFDTAYQILIKEGALEHKTEDGIITNPEIKLSFITNKDTIDFYHHWSSIIDTKSMDDLSWYVKKPESTWLENALTPDGTIYLTFRDDGERNDDKIEDFLKIVSSKENLKDYFKLYKIPKSLSKSQNEIGKEGYGELSDILTQYDSQGNSTAGKEEEILIDSVKLVNFSGSTDKKSYDAIAIKPKYPLLPLNAYRVKMTDTSILKLGARTAKEEDFSAIRNLSSPIDDIIWTAPLKDKKQLWPARISDEKNITSDADLIGEEIVEGKTLSAKNTAFVIGGMHQYSPSEPIRIPLNDRIVFNPSLEDWYNHFKLEYGYYTVKDKDAKFSDSNFVAEGNIAISKFGIEERTVNAGNGLEKRSTLLIYPSSTLQSGTDYRLSINLYEKEKGLFISPILSRSNIGISDKDGNLASWMFYFSSEGESQSQTGAGVYDFIINGNIDKELYTLKELKTLLTNTENGNNGQGYFNLPELAIYGYNFTEDIEKVVLKSENGRTITIDNRKKVKVINDGKTFERYPLEFESVSKITGFIPLEALREMVWEEGACFNRKSTEGLYEIDVIFSKSSVAIGKSTKDKPLFVIVDRPYIVNSYPYPNQKYVDADTMKPLGAKSVYLLNQSDRDISESAINEVLPEILGDAVKDEIIEISKNSFKISLLKEILNTPFTAENLDRVKSKIKDLIEDKDEEREKTREEKFLEFYKRTKQNQRDLGSGDKYFEKLYSIFSDFTVINSGNTVSNKKIDSKDLVLPKDRYYIQLKFKDFMDSLKLKENAHAALSMYEVGNKGVADETKANMIDPAVPIYSEKNSQGEIVYWVALTGKPDNNKTYEVKIAENMFVEYMGLEDVEVQGNHPCSFKFSTNAVPKHKRLYEGSVPENYDPNYPIALDMDFADLGYNKSDLSKAVSVYFRDNSGKIYLPGRIIREETNNETLRLYLFLPMPRLKVGLYDIIIVFNGNEMSQYKDEMVYGVFSVVKGGEFPPNAEYKLIIKNEKIEIKKDKKTSKDTIKIKSPDSLADEGVKTDYDTVEIDLEKINQSAKRRNVEISRGTIPKLIIKFKEGSFVFNNASSIVGDISCNVGGALLSEKSDLKRKLRGNTIKSEFISIDDLNFSFGYMEVSLHYTGNATEKYKIYRYDEDERDFEVLETEFDELTNIATAQTSKTGTFVVVKER